MHNQDPTGTHKRGKKKSGLKCPKCGWSFPIQYPTVKAKRAHNEICGTIEGYILEVEQKEGDRLNPSVGAERVDEKEGSSEDNKAETLRHAQSQSNAHTHKHVQPDAAGERSETILRI
ncbi:hypothetical protein P8452_14508 [Trifolium repens]|nr:hypothetical protein P8452_14508 [Trifolium repens]